MIRNTKYDLNVTFSRVYSSRPPVQTKLTRKRILHAIKGHVNVVLTKFWEKSQNFIESQSFKSCWDHSFSTYTKFYEKLTVLTSWYGVRNISFSENFVYVLNEWPFENLSGLGQRRDGDSGPGLPVSAVLKRSVCS